MTREFPERFVWLATTIRRRRWLILSSTILLVAGSLVGLHFWGLHHYRAMENAIRDRSLDTARDHLLWSLQLRPYDSDLLLIGSRIERLDEKLGKAQEYLDRHKNRYGKTTESYQLEAILLRAYTNHITETERGLLNFANTSPDSELTPFVLEALARGYMKIGRFRAADAMLTRWLQSDPNNPRAYFWRGSVRNWLNMSSDAIADFQRAVELDSGDWKKRMLYVTLLMKDNNIAAARKHLALLEKEHADDLQVKMVKAQILFAENKLDESERVFRSIVKADANNSEAFHQIGRIEYQRGHVEKAAEASRQAVKLKPSNTAAQFLLYQSLSQLPGREAEAKAQFQRFNQIDGEMKRLQNLITDELESSVQGSVDVMHQIGALSLKLGFDKQGLQWLRKTLLQNPNHQPTHSLLAEYYSQHNQPRLAARHRNSLHQKPK